MIIILDFELVSDSSLSLSLVVRRIVSQSKQRKGKGEHPDK